MISLTRIIKATFLERSRRLSYWALIILTLIAAVIGYPRIKGPIKVFVLEPNLFIQANNPSWVPVSVVLVLGLFLPIISYLFLKNTIEIDDQNHTNVLMASVSFSKINYIGGKFLANCLLLFILWIVIILGTIIMVILQFPGKFIDFYQFLTPFLTLLPGIFIISTLAIFTEIVPFLRGILGIILVSFFSLICYGVSIENYNSFFLKIINPSGSSYLFKMIQDTCIKTVGQPLKQTMLLSSGNFKETGKQTLFFLPIKFTQQDLLIFIIQLIICIVMLILAGFIFSPHKYSNKIRKNSIPINLVHDHHKLKTINSKSASSSLLKTSFALLWRPLSIYNKLALIILWLTAWLSSLAIKQLIILPLILLTELPLLSNLGSQITQFGFYQWLITIPKAQNKQQFFEYVASLTFTLILLLPFMLKSSYIALLLVCFSIMLCMLAQVLGLITKSNRMFIFLMVIFCFIYLNGITNLLPINKLNPSVCLVYLGVTLVLFLIKCSLKQLIK